MKSYLILAYTYISIYIYIGKRDTNPKVTKKGVVCHPIGNRGHFPVAL